MLTPSLCEHTTPPPKPWSAFPFLLPPSRLNIVRHFSYKGKIVSFRLSAIEDIFHLRGPRLQIVKDKEVEKEGEVVAPRSYSTADEADVEKQSDAEKRLLRREIKSWWESVADHMDMLVSLFTCGFICLLNDISCRRT